MKCSVMLITKQQENECRILYLYFDYLVSDISDLKKNVHIPAFNYCFAYV